MTKKIVPYCLGCGRKSVTLYCERCAPQPREGPMYRFLDSHNHPTTGRWRNGTTVDRRSHQERAAFDSNYEPTALPDK